MADGVGLTSVATASSLFNGVTLRRVFRLFIVFSSNDGLIGVV